MKTSISIFIIISISACVSATKYKSLKTETELLKLRKKSINKEIRLVESENKILIDSIDKIKQIASLEITKIEKRLAKHKIYVKLDQKEFSNLRVEKQDISVERYKYLKESCNFTDTNSAKNTNWLSSKERELIYWLNYVRLNPKKFCMDYIYAYYLRNKNDVYVATLMDYLLQMKPVPALYPDKELFESAKCHAETMGKEGKFGHKRIEGCKSKFRGECCSYGVAEPLGVVIQLLIDRGVYSLGHRYICLGTYTKIGVSEKPHKTFRINYVLDFGYK